MSSRRFLLEGEWTGYRPEQRRVVHVEVIKEELAEKLEGVRGIIFTDGTKLLLSVAPLRNEEGHFKRDQYGLLIREAANAGLEWFHVKPEK